MLPLTVLSCEAEILRTTNKISYLNQELKDARYRKFTLRKHLKKLQSRRLVSKFRFKRSY